MPDIFQSNTIDTNTNPQTNTGNIPNPLEKKLPIAPLPTNHNRLGIMSNYVETPDGIHFETQEPNERILLFLRRDFITNVPWILTTIILIVIPFGISYVNQITPISLPIITPQLTGILQAFFYLIIATYAFINYITWYFNVSLVTTLRVLDIEFSQLIYKNIAGTKISLVQDVSFTQIGAIRSLFNYGDVLVQTAGAVDNFDFQAVPRPDRVVQIVEDLIGKNQNAV